MTVDTGVTGKIALSQSVFHKMVRSCRIRASSQVNWNLSHHKRPPVCVSELQTSVDALLAEKLQLEQQVEDLTKETVQLREQVHVCLCVCVCVCVCSS